MCNPRPFTKINTTYTRNNFVTKEQASQNALFFNKTYHRIIVKHSLATFRWLQKVEGTVVELILIFGIGEILSFCIFFVTKFYVQSRCSVC